MSRKPYHPYSRDSGRESKSRDSGRSSHSHGPIRDHSGGSGSGRGGGSSSGGGSGGGEDSGWDPRSVYERPTRTLFVRNVNYSVTEKYLKEIFEKYGEIKRIFNLIDKRGMAFVTYYDSRDSERAKNALQGKEVQGRPIDVHYALPKEDGTEVFPEDKNTGTLFVTFRSVGKIPVNSEVRTFFEKWGPIREVRDCKNSPNQKFIEYYDLRDSEKAFDNALNAKYGEGTLDVKYAFLHKKSKDEKSGSGSGSYADEKDAPYVPTSLPPSSSLPPGPNLMTSTLQPTWNTLPGTSAQPLPTLPNYNIYGGGYPTLSTGYSTTPIHFDSQSSLTSGGHSLSLDPSNPLAGFQNLQPSGGYTTTSLPQTLGNPTLTIDPALLALLNPQSGATQQPSPQLQNLQQILSLLIQQQQQQPTQK